MNNESFIVPYRGRRDYVHGTTMFALLAALAGPSASSFDFRVSRRLDSNRLRLLENLPADTAGQLPCAMWWESGGTLHSAALEEAGAPDPSVRDAYDEAALVDRALFEPERPAVTCALAPPIRLIDMVVALNKELLSRHLPLAAGSQYVFTRLELQSLPPATCQLKLEYWRAVGGVHFITRIAADETRCGTIHFSRWSRT